MSISSKFSVAVHTMLLIAGSGEECSSKWIAGSVNTNPVVIRRIIGSLKKSQLLLGNQGRSGYSFTKLADKISLLDIYKAVENSESDKLFSIHENPNVECPVGSVIQLLLESILINAQEAMEAVLREISLQDLIDRMSEEKKRK